MYLEEKSSFTKYRSRRLKFPRLKDFVKKINVDWSLDLAFVDKFAKFNRGVKQPEKVWVDDGTEFIGAFKTLCTERGIHLHSTFSEKSLICEKKYTLLKNIIYR